ncbi:MAG: hypothetical protein V4632_19140 [Pseudomonadota bacterium]
MDRHVMPGICPDCLPEQGKNPDAVHVQKLQHVVLRDLVCLSFSIRGAAPVFFQVAGMDRGFEGMTYPAAQCAALIDALLNADSGH